MLKNLTDAHKKAALIIIIASAVLYLDFSFVLKHQLSSLKNISQKLHQMKVSLKQYKSNYAHIKNLQADVDRIKAKSTSIEKNIFSDAELPSLMETISQKAITSGIKIMQMKPQGVSDQNEKIRDDAAGLQLYPFTIKLHLACGYHQLGSFLALIEDNPLMAVADLKVNSNSAELTKQNVELLLRVYVNKK